MVRLREQIKPTKGNWVANDSIDKIIDALDPLVKKLGEGATFTYETLYRQVIIGAVTRFVIAAVILTISLVIWRKLWPWVVAGNERAKEKSGSYSHNDAWAFALFAIYAGWVVGAIVFVGVVLEGVLMLINPHFYAIQRLLDVL